MRRAIACSVECAALRANTAFAKESTTMTMGISEQSNSTSAPVTADDSPVTLTEVAAAKVKEIAKEEGLEGQGLRVQVKGGGCSGFQYDLFFDEKPTDMDQVVQSRGVTLFIDPLSAQYLEGTEIDYVEGLSGAGFKFGNPNVKGTCGCGSSFSV
jgi:iron-sulfur cluster insertion protein